LTAAIPSSPARFGQPASVPPARIALFAATGWELEAVRAAFPAGCEKMHEGRRVVISRIGDHEFWLIRTGIGHEKAGRAAAWLLAQRPFKLVISTGFACALVPAAIGALLMGRAVTFLRGDGAEPLRPVQSSLSDQDQLVAFMVGQTLPHHCGPFVSVDEIVVRAEEKREYARITGAIGLDMESAALAIASQQAQVPFLILRTVSDLLDEDLPLDFNLFRKPTGWPRGIGSLLMAPSRLRGIRRLRRQSRAAAAQLTQVFRAYAGAITPQVPAVEHA
jgi:adenosylhomocysteine nucleosidase